MRILPQSINFIHSMNPQKTSYIHQSHSTVSLPRSYKVPREYIDCQQLLKKKIHGPTGTSKHQMTTKQKAKFKKTFYLDETIKHVKDIPSPDKYHENYTTQKRFKSQSTFITKPKQNQKSLGKRPTWIEDIQRYEQKYQPPAAGKYNLLTNSDFNLPKKPTSIQKLLKNGTKYNNFDDSIYVAAKIPGPGSHNPHKSVPKLKVNMQNCKFWIEKHEKDKKSQEKKLNQTKTSSFLYSPVLDKTFDSIKKTPKQESTLMRLTKIDKRKGLNELVSSPGPGSHNIFNRWASQTFKRQNLLGKANIFAKTTRSLPSLKVYH